MCTVITLNNRYIYWHKPNKHRYVAIVFSTQDASLVRMRNLHKRRLLVALKGCRPVYMRAPSYSAIAIISRTMANCSCASDTSTPSDVTNWLATPAPFNAEKHGARAVFSGDDSSVVERREPDDHCDGGVAYTASPLPLGHVWQITLLNTTGRQWGFGLVRCMYTVERL